MAYPDYTKLYLPTIITNNQKWVFENKMTWRELGSVFPDAPALKTQKN